MKPRLRGEEARDFDKATSSPFSEIPQLVPLPPGDRRRDGTRCIHADNQYATCTVSKTAHILPNHIRSFLVDQLIPVLIFEIVISLACFATRSSSSAGLM
jgi:hypothetical protein